MPDYEVLVDFEYETDVEIDFSNYTTEEIKEIIEIMMAGMTYTFKDVCINVVADTTVDVEPPLRDW